MPGLADRPTLSNIHLGQSAGAVFGDGASGWLWRSGVTRAQFDILAVEELQAVIAGVDDRIDVTTWPVRANIERTLEDRKLAANVAWAIGALGLALATIGVFGVFAYVVEERRREIGIRVALGATARDVARALFAVSRWSVGGGLLAGLVLSVIGGFTLRSYLFGLSPLDPAAYAIVIAVLLVAAALATVVPSRRAMRVDPAVTLRAE